MHIRFIRYLQIYLDCSSSECSLFYEGYSLQKIYKNDKTLGKLTYFIKTALLCVPFSRQNYELHCQSLFVLQCSDSILTLARFVKRS